MIVFSEIENYADDLGNSIVLGENIQFQSSVITMRKRNGQIFLGSNIKLSQASIEIGQNSVLEISDGVTISGKIFVGKNSVIKIGQNLSVTANLVIRAAESTVIEIGDGCLFGSDVIIRSYDGHPVYDAVTRIRLNSGKSIHIGAHVWISDRAVILKGSRVGDASIIGLGSVLTGEVPKNSIAAGNPARVVKSGIVWEHSPNIKTEEFYVSDQLDPDI